MLVYDPKKIRLLREERGWKQSELARRAGIAQPSLWAYEHGRVKMPKLMTMAAIAGALGVPLQDIMARPGAKEASNLGDELMSAYEALDERNKATLAAVAQTLLKSQKPR